MKKNTKSPPSTSAKSGKTSTSTLSWIHQLDSQDEGGLAFDGDTLIMVEKGNRRPVTVLQAVRLLLDFHAAARWGNVSSAADDDGTYRWLNRLSKVLKTA
ncbi:MAG: hypothetical protein ACYDC1_16445 [Limisphaerales bacterium]